MHSWNADFVKNSAAGVQYQNLANEIDRALAFMVACGIDDDVFRTVDFYSSHEALLLEYEHASTRIDSRTGCRTTRPAISCGSASVPVSWTARTWS